MPKRRSFLLCKSGTKLFRYRVVARAANVRGDYPLLNSLSKLATWGAAPLKGRP
jgi:hypothetical protein